MDVGIGDHSEDEAMSGMECSIVHVIVVDTEFVNSLCTSADNAFNIVYDRSLVGARFGRDGKRGHVNFATFLSSGMMPARLCFPFSLS